MYEALKGNTKSIYLGCKYYKNPTWSCSLYSLFLGQFIPSLRVFVMIMAPLALTFTSTVFREREKWASLKPSKSDAAPNIVALVFNKRLYFVSSEALSSYTPSAMLCCAMLFFPPYSHPPQLKPKTNKQKTSLQLLY